MATSDIHMYIGSVASYICICMYIYVHTYTYTAENFYGCFTVCMHIHVWICGESLSRYNNIPVVQAITWKTLSIVQHRQEEYKDKMVRFVTYLHTYVYKCHNTMYIYWPIYFLDTYACTYVQICMYIYVATGADAKIFKQGDWYIYSNQNHPESQTEKDVKSKEVPRPAFKFLIMMTMQSSKH